MAETKSTVNTNPVNLDKQDENNNMIKVSLQTPHKSNLSTSPRTPIQIVPSTSNDTTPATPTCTPTSNYSVSPARHMATVPVKQLKQLKITGATVMLERLPCALREYIDEKVRLCQPDAIHICDGSQTEYEGFLKMLHEAGCAEPLDKMKDCWLTLTDPDDVARVESRTIISTKNQLDTIPTPKGGFKEAPASANLRNLKVSALQLDGAR